MTRMANAQSRVRLAVLAAVCLLWAGASAFAQPETRVDIPPGGMVHPAVHLATPLPGSDVTSPLRIVGEARGTWYFEGSFAIRLFDRSGRELGVAVAQAREPWMTEAFVPFEAQLTFDAPANTCLVMVLEKANPSGLPEHDEEVQVGLRCTLEK